MGVVAKITVGALVTHFVLSSYAVRELNKELGDLKKKLEEYRQDNITLLKNRQQMLNWINIVRSAMIAHYENGGTIDLPQEMMDDIDAYLIMSQNGMG